MDIYEESLLVHKKLRGKIEINFKGEINDKKDLSLLYSPGVAAPCLEIEKNYFDSYKYTSKGNLVAVITNGTAVLGLGDIGADASMPVMEGKAALFKRFAGVNAFPICIDSKDPDKVIETVKLISPSFGAINLEDISAPTCFYIEEKLKEILDIPVFHDDQHGTAIVCLAALLNALKVVKKDISKIKIVLNGVGSAGMAIAKLLLHFGVKNLVACDKNGIIFNDELSDAKLFEKKTLDNKNNAVSYGSLNDALKNADVFIGVSVGGALTKEMIASMADKPIVFAMANPTPEIMPDLAKEAGAFIISTGRTDFPNQINNVLAFPGIFKGALDVLATQINDEMKEAAVYAIKDLISDEELNENYIIPSVFDERVALKVAEAVSKKAIETGVSRIIN